ncbi:uncharacterized protein Z518_08080 [Rhinocladiella mackenziei CBS 650.93]|uniref:Anaphase-promoting complex subunit 4-like WD40 domain-containing protein n=1 Tax=Rhinocladiella mackenziei CBS 650.93 TaxID=1442369 RepID=A0A0D2IFU6_9EURO|nr:uncharacterized protein Z518_08080 [Rhinocladiella mackenziei CBS 650.93]KIX02141.1 hypothetical protein Z518_08080 [Rhinocladiella mackenziei CBS 650.93]
METDNGSTFNAKPPPLTSDQLNYLIWRYLQESGYAEAAVKLQRDWKVDAESLPFAKAIKGHALVSLVQKGLRYHHLSLTIDENGRPSKQLNPSMFFFGPENEKPPPELPEELLPPAPSPDPSATARRKAVRDVIPNGVPEVPPQPAPKRGRKTAASSERNGSAARKQSSSANQGMDVDMMNGHPTSLADARSPSATEAGIDENGTMVNGTRMDERMDVDEESLTADQQHHEVHVEVVPPPIHTLTTGASIGVQVAPAKAADLTPSTSVLQIPSPAGVEESKALTRVCWRPGDNNIVTAMGDNFCGVWNTSERSSDSDSVPSFHELVESTETNLVSAVAWEPNGEMLAVATYTNHSGQIHLFDGQELTLMEALPASQRAITSLQWQDRGLRLLGIAPYDSENSESDQDGGSSILLWDLSKSPNVTGPMSMFVPEILVDMDCASFGGNAIVCVSGQNAVYHCRALLDLGIEQKWTSNSADSDQWTFVRCAWRGTTDAILLAASADTGCLWMPAQGIMKQDAHEAPITGLELRPRLRNALNPSLKSEFASSSMDGTIRVWRYDEDSNSIISICKLIIGHTSPVMTLSYSPDGFCLAGASYDTIRIWNAEHSHNHMATWKGEQDSWNGSRLKDDDIMSVGGISSMNGDALQASADHALTWDAESKKLAFGLGSQVAVVDFQR